ncbi:hypothetical protein MMC18_001228 [Xylographa bjoerkii]|nr:hypothetical protein [Xylographa bjoerkii]
MSFGFSLGDVVAALAVIHDVIGSLRDAVGAGEEYQQLMQELCLLETAMTKVKQLEIDDLQHEDRMGLNTAALQDQRHHSHLRTMYGKIQDLSVQWMGTLVAVSENVMDGVQQGKKLLDMTSESMQIGLKIFKLVKDTNHRVIAMIPAQVQQQQQPVFLIDALGMAATFNLESIRSADALTAVLNSNFRNIPGAPAKIENGEFFIEDAVTKREVDLSQSWELCFRPGQRVWMSMVFNRPHAHPRFCPNCQTLVKSPRREGNECQVCGLLYQSALDANPYQILYSIPRMNLSGPEPAPESYTSSKKEIDEELTVFRRVRIIRSCIIICKEK